MALPFQSFLAMPIQSQKLLAILKIVIADQGSGIPNQHQAKVFRPFYRLESSRNRASGGSGLGLAIVKQLVDSHNWQVSLNPRENGGTNAVVTISV